MYTVPLVLRSQSSQAFATAPQTRDSSVETAQDSSFDSLVRGLLKPDQANNVNEEELFAALVQERVYSLKGQEAGDAFKATFEKSKMENAGLNGYVFLENAARDALKEYQSSGALTAEEADRIHSEAFRAAQLDSNHTALFDGHGGPNDPTRAVASIDAALTAAGALLAKYDAGSEEAPEYALNADYSAMGTLPLKSEEVQGHGGKENIGRRRAGEYKLRNGKIDGVDGMLWKPESETQGTLIMMLPPSYTDQVQKITLRDSEGRRIENGRYFSVGAGPTGREKWVFSKRGDRYPEDVRVDIKFRDGNVQTLLIPKPGQRYD